MEEAKGIIRTAATAQDPTLVRCFRGHEKTVNSVAFCPEMKQVASASSDGIVHVWSFKPQLRPFKFVGHVGSVNDVIFTSNSSKIISCGDDRQIKFWKNSVQSRATSVKAHSGPVLGLALSESASSKFLLSCSTDKSLKAWSLEGKFKQSYLGHTNWVRECQIAHDQRVMLSCSDDRTVKLWDIETAKVAVSFSDHKDAVYTCKFSPDGTCIAGGSKDGTIKLWDTRNNKLIQHYNAHGGPVNRLDFHPFGYHMSSVSDDGKIKVWELKHGRLGWTLYGHNGQIKALDFSRKGDYFVTGAEDSLVMIWRSNFDEGLAMPSRAEQTNYIEKGKDTLQPMFKSNKLVSNGDIHKGLARFGGAATDFGEEFGNKKDVENDSQQMNVDPRKKNIAEIMSSGLEKLVNQLDFVTRTIGSLEERITQHERTVQGLFQHPKVADYLSMLEESEKMKPEIYNSVWEAFRNAQHEPTGLARTSQRLNDPEFEDIAADFESLNKNLSDKKLPTMAVLDDGRAERFKQELAADDVDFDEQQLQQGQEPGQQF